MDDYDFDNEFDVDEFDGPSKKTVTKTQNEKDSDPYFKRKQSFGEKDKKDNNGFEPFDDEIEDWDDPETTKPKPKKEEPKKKETPKPIEKDIDFKPARQSQNKVVVQKRKESEEFADDFEEEIETPKQKPQPKPDIKPQVKAEPKYEPKKEISSPLKNDYDDDEDFDKEPEVSPVKPKQQVVVEDHSKKNKVHSPPVQHKKEETYSDEELEDEEEDYKVETKPKVVHHQKSPVQEKPIPQNVRAEMQTYEKIFIEKTYFYSPQYQKLVEQNKKLKTELRELAKAADEALQRERNNKTTKKRKDDEPELQGILY